MLVQVKVSATKLGAMRDVAVKVGALDPRKISATEILISVPYPWR
jgi:hypothetical protein